MLVTEGLNGRVIVAVVFVSLSEHCVQATRTQICVIMHTRALCTTCHPHKHSLFKITMCFFKQNNHSLYDQCTVKGHFFVTYFTFLKSSQGFCCLDVQSLRIYEEVTACSILQSGRSTGRYCLPVETVQIVTDRKDLDVFDVEFAFPQLILYVRRPLSHTYEK